MATAKITVRELRLSDMPSFVELCESRDGLDSESAVLRGQVVEHLAFGNPHDDGKPTYLVGVQGDKIVAHLGRMPTRFCVNGRIEHGSYFHDLYVDPAIRNVGAQGFFLSMQLYAAAEEASSGFIAMIWTNEINIALQTARKYHQMWTERLVKLLRADEKIDQTFPGWIGPGLKLLARHALHGIDIAKQVVTKQQGVIEIVECFDERFDALSDSILRSKTVTPYKDSAYLNWKYCIRPGLRTIIHTAVDESGQLNGFSVVTAPVPGYNSSYLAEFIVPDKDSVTMRNLLDASIRSARSTGATRLTAAATDVQHHAALVSRLFSARKNPDPLFMAKAERSAEKNCILQTDNWHLSFGDSEGPF